MSTQNFVIAAADTTLAQSSAQTSAPQTVATTEATGKGGFSAKPTFAEVAEFQLTGLLVVFFVLGAITLISMLSSWLLKVLAPGQYYVKPVKAPAAPVAAAAKPAAVAAATIHPGLSNDRLLAILAAAAEEAFGKPVSIVSFSNVDSTWSTQGRLAIHSSHKL